MTKFLSNINMGNDEMDFGNKEIDPVKYGVL
jgi:hypothetical protein